MDQFEGHNFIPTTGLPDVDIQEVPKHVADCVVHRVLYLWFRASQIYFTTNDQRDAALSSLYLLRNHSTCFGCSLHPSSGVHKTVVTTTGTSNVLV